MVYFNISGPDIAVLSEDITFENYQEMITALETNDAMFKDAMICGIGNPKVRKQLSLTSIDAQSGPDKLLKAKMLNDEYPFYSTRLIPANLSRTPTGSSTAATNQSPFMLGDFSRSLKVMYGTLFVAIDYNSDSINSTAEIAINFFRYLGFAHLRPSSYVVRYEGF